MDEEKDKQEALDETADISSTVKPVRKKRRLFLLLLFLTAIAAAVAWSPLLSLEKIELTGQTSLAEEEVWRIMDVYHGEPLVLVNTEEAARSLRKDLRVEKASVQYVFPHGLRVSLTERQPLALIACDYGYLNVDRDARVLSASRHFCRAGVPFIVGIDCRDAYIGDTLQGEYLAGVLDFLSRFDPDTRAQLDKIVVNTEGYATAYVPGAVEIRIGKLERLDEKAKITKDFLAELKTAKYPIEYIDLNYTSPFIKFK